MDKITKKMEDAAVKENVKELRDLIKGSVVITNDPQKLCRELAILLDLAKRRPSFTPVIMHKSTFDSLIEVFELSEKTELGRRATDGRGKPFALRLLKGTASAMLKKPGSGGNTKLKELSITLFRDRKRLEKLLTPVNTR